MQVTSHYLEKLRRLKTNLVRLKTRVETVTPPAIPHSTASKLQLPEQGLSDEPVPLPARYQGAAWESGDATGFSEP